MENSYPLMCFLIFPLLKASHWSTIKANIKVWNWLGHSRHCRFSSSSSLCSLISNSIMSSLVGSLDLVLNAAFPWSLNSQSRFSISLISTSGSSKIFFTCGLHPKLFFGTTGFVPSGNLPSFATLSSAAVADDAANVLSIDSGWTSIILPCCILSSFPATNPSRICSDTVSPSSSSQRILSGLPANRTLVIFP